MEGMIYFFSFLLMALLFVLLGTVCTALKAAYKNVGTLNGKPVNAGMLNQLYRRYDYKSLSKIKFTDAVQKAAYSKWVGSTAERIRKMNMGKMPEISSIPDDIIMILAFVRDENLRTQMLETQTRMLSEQLVAGCAPETLFPAGCSMDTLFPAGCDMGMQMVDTVQSFVDQSLAMADLGSTPFSMGGLDLAKDMLGGFQHTNPFGEGLVGSNMGGFDSFGSSGGGFDSFGGMGF